jgi:hypothetical protein
MACDIFSGRDESCKDSISGLLAVYVVNFGIDVDNITYDATDTDLISAIPLTNIYGFDIHLYRFDLKGENSFDQDIKTDRNTGTTYFEQKLNIKLKKQDVETTKMIKILSYGRPQIVVHTRSNQFFLMGLEQGADVVSGTIGSGTKLGDFNGYSLSFMAEEKVPANFLDCGTEGQLLALFGGAALN